MNDGINQLESNAEIRNHGFVFILTPIDLLCPEGVEIAPNHRIVKANEKQRFDIKKTLEQLRYGPLMRPSPYENNLRYIQGDKSGEFSYSQESLPFEKWRYWVVEFDGINSEIQELVWACSLIPNDIELGFYFIYHQSFAGSGFGWNPNSTHAFFNANTIGFIKAKQLGQIDLIKIRQNYDKIKNLEPEYEHIRRALLRFDQLQGLPRTSEMVVIGLVSIIESLVSHAPRLTDSTDSLSHQLKTKLPLLRKRFTDPLEHHQHFPNIEEENLWKKLYGFRSKIVHGENSQMTGELSSLRNIETVINFLKETSKRLLELSLREPQFMTDLKKC